MLGLGFMSQRESPPQNTTTTRDALVGLARALVLLEGKLVGLERKMQPSLARVPRERREGARNLVHYIALRRQDLRDLQSALALRGLSSLGRSESCVMATLLEVSERVHEAAVVQDIHGARPQLARLQRRHEAEMSWEAANADLHRHTREVLGPRPEHRHIYIMVTAPNTQEDERPWMVKLLNAGMNVLRINCAHDNEAQWERTIAALRAAQRETGRECRVLMDLAGPKIRTGRVGGSRKIATWRPDRDEIGNVTAPARVMIHRASLPSTGTPRVGLQARDESLGKLRRGDELRFRDARGKKRRLQVEAVGRDALTCAASARAYVVDRVLARVCRAGADLGELNLEVCDGEGAAVDVRVGDPLFLTGRDVTGRAPRRDGDGGVVTPGLITCTLPAALDHLALGHRVLFDDGRIHAVVERAGGRRGKHLLRVVRTVKETVKLRAEKGINLPDTPTKMPSLTPQDLAALPFVARHADAVGLSFVRGPEDLRALHDALGRLGGRPMATVIKIETRTGFEHLPGLLLEGLRHGPLGVMIARGDLAVEVGFERLAELQEEILWLCEAAHVPTIWATQVLDTLSRTGVPSRAEVTDAAASVGAECVMLNKGPFVDQAVRVLSDILSRMEQHHYKKRSLFRKLQVSTFEPAAAATDGAPTIAASAARLLPRPIQRLAVT